MSPSPGDAPPRTPERKSSSSSILQAFRNLTAGRPKSASTSQSAFGFTPVQPALPKAEPVQQLANKRSFSENDSNSTISRSVQRSKSDPSTAPIIGAPPELAQLLPQLDQAQPLAERIQVAYKICDILDKYRVNNPLVIWSSAQDLLLQESDDASRAGHSLLVCLAKSSDLSPMERSVLFESIESLEDGRHIDLRFQALQELTSHGRNVEALETQLAPFVARVLDVNYAVVARIRKKEKKKRSATAANEETSFEGLFQYVVDVIKFNSRLFGEQDYALLLEQVILICKNTTCESDIRNSIHVINALITYTQVPTSSIRPCLELLCEVYKQVPPLKKPTWNALSNIFRSHLAESAVAIYLDIIDTPATSSQGRALIRGAFRVIAHLFEKNGRNDFPKIPLHRLLPAILSALKSGDRMLATDVLHHFRIYLDDENLRVVVESEHEWDDFVDAIIECSELLAMSSASRKTVTPDVANDDQSTKSGNQESDRPSASDTLEHIVSTLSGIFPGLDILHKEAVVALYFGLGSRLSNNAAEVLVAHCAEDRLLYPSNPNWLDNFKDIATNLLHDKNRPSHLRLSVASLVKDAYQMIELMAVESSSDLALLVLKKMSEETDGDVLEALASFGVTVVEHADDELFNSVLNIFGATVFQQRMSMSSSQNFSPAAGIPVGMPIQPEPSLCRIASKHVIRMFISNANKSARKGEALFDFVLKVAGSNDCATDARICAVKLLFRLRATSEYAIYIRPLSESESVAAVLCRTAESANWHISPEDLPARDTRNVSSGGTQISKTKAFNVKRPVPPLWFYPGPKGLPEEPPHEPSQCLYSFVDPAIAGSSDKTVLRLTHWLETVIDLLQRQDTDWEIYSYVVVHLGAQLSNQNLFRGAIPQVKFLRNVLCDQIRAANFHDPPSYTSLKKADVAICLFHVQTMLVSYHSHYARSEEDELVRSFILGIGSWDRTSKWCIHALTICCHELPLSVSKQLDSILHKMSQIITQSQIAIHILEFLVMLARLPELYKNFREDEYKMVFGVSFRYLQYVRDQQEKEMDKDTPNLPPSRQGRTMRHSDSFRELRLNHEETRLKSRSAPEDFPQYVYALAFHVITFWYMNLKLQDRPTYMPWIAKNLTYTDKDGVEHVEDQDLVTMDMMERIAYSDRDETEYKAKFASETDGEVAQRTYIIGYSLLTIETAGRTGLSQLTRRRPSGTKYSIYRPSLTSPPRHQVPLTTGLAADVFYTSSYIGVLPEDILQEFYSSYNLLDSKSPRPIPLPAKEDAVTRTITLFDRNSTVDGHKVGVIYMAEGQTDEVDILRNTHGSADYTSFIGSLGFLTRLKDAKLNSHGLDKVSDEDGEYTYCWRDRATEIVFHVTTMMPTKIEDDPRCNNKKAHIGNDYVNVIWNESGHEFNFDTFPSQFNYVYIVITPETKHSFTSIRDKEHQPSLFYKVQVLSGPGFPEISPAAETKVLNGKALPSFVRLLALNASVFSLVWHNREGGEHFSPWRNRLREIKRLRERYITQRSSHTTTQSPYGQTPSPATGSGVGSVPPSTQEKTLSDAQKGHGLGVISPPTSRERGTSALSNRISMATFSGSDNLSRSSLTTSSRGDGPNETDHGGDW